MRIAVVGAGGIGSLFGGRLAAARHEVWFVVRRPEHVAALNESGLQLDGERIRVRATADSSAVGAVDLVLILTKATDTRAAAEAARSLVGQRSLVVTLQNGLGNYETIGELLGSERVLVGMTYHGASLDAPGRARHTARGQTFVGEPSSDGGLSQRAIDLANVFTQAGLPTEATGRLWSMVWGKLIVNAALNAPCALTGAAGSDVLASSNLRAYVGRVAHECAAVAAVIPVELPYPDAAERVWQHCQTIQDARPSMLQDIERGRSTEIDAINGAIVREGARLGVPTPLNQALVALVKGREDVSVRARAASATRSSTSSTG